MDQPLDRLDEVADDPRITSIEVRGSTPTLEANDGGNRQDH